jgi:hypothetical protein
LFGGSWGKAACLSDTDGTKAETAAREGVQPMSIDEVLAPEDYEVAERSSRQRLARARAALEEANPGTRAADGPPRSGEDYERALLELLEGARERAAILLRRPLQPVDGCPAWAFAEVPWRSFSEDGSPEGPDGEHADL